jgi:citrate synthase
MHFIFLMTPGRPTFFLAFRIVDNTVPATAFKSMTAQRAPGEREENETEKGLRVSDRGFLNTAVLRSQITFIDGEAGGMRLAA